MQNAECRMKIIAFDFRIALNVSRETIFNFAFSILNSAFDAQLIGCASLFHVKHKKLTTKNLKICFNTRHDCGTIQIEIFI